MSGLPIASAFTFSILRDSLVIKKAQTGFRGDFVWGMPLHFGRACRQRRNLVRVSGGVEISVDFSHWIHQWRKEATPPRRKRPGFSRD